MSDTGSVTGLLLQLHSPDPVARERAIAGLISRYTPELLALIAGRMHQRLQRRVGAEDVLQEVFLSFSRRYGRVGYDLANRDQFLGLVVTMALNKVCSAANRERRLRRDMWRDVSLESSADDRPSFDVPDLRAEGPDAVAEVADEVGRLLGGLPTDCREVALLRLEGYTVEEIARKIDRTTRTVERRLERIRDLWQDRLPTDGG